MTAAGEDLFAALQAAAQAAVAAGPVDLLVAGIDDVPGTNGRQSQNLPPRWAEVGVTRSGGGVYRAGRTTTSMHYLTVGVAEQNRGSVGVWHDQFRSALEGREVVVGGRRTTPLRFYAETDTEWLADLSRYWRLVTYSFAI